MKGRRFVFVLVLLITVFSTSSLGSDLRLRSFWIMFWNVENYFDPFDDPLTNDEEFTPSGDKHWTWSRFIKKRDAIAKTILASGDEYGDYPILIGLAEIENRMVLNQLCHQTVLSKLNYRYIHYDSPDRRGVDVALLYREEFFKPIQTESYQMELPDSLQHTRSVLYVKGVVYGYDTLHLLVNHWPSKLGGEKNSLPRRMAVSRQVRTICDSILISDESSNIVIMGDFNDTPRSKPLKYLEKGEGTLPSLINPGVKGGLKRSGTIKYKGEWEMIDHFFISSSLQRDMSDFQDIFIEKESVNIFSPPFLLEDDTTYYGKKPFRVYLGPGYLGGVSDHLPIFLEAQIFTL